MRWSIAMAVAGLLTLSSGAALAQYEGGGIEIIPFGGYRWGGGLSTVSILRDFDTKDAASYGVSLGKRLPRDSAVEIVYTHFEADVEATLLDGTVLTGGPIKRDDIMLNGTWYAARSSSVLPFFTAGLGASIFASERTETIGRFAWNIGAGLRKDMSEKFGLKITGLWTPVWVTTGSGVWCDPFYCYATGTGEFYDQFEVSGGLIIKL